MLISCLCVEKLLCFKTYLFVQHNICILTTAC